MLLQLRDYIAREKRVSTQQLSRLFHVDLSALEPMLDRWVLKGEIARDGQKACMTSCGGCKTSAVSYYRYVGEKGA
ncbi:MAG: FeoC-like transcriptional regulator [Legionellaceae bacterium]